MICERCKKDPAIVYGLFCANCIEGTNSLRITDWLAFVSMVLFMLAVWRWV